MKVELDYYEELITIKTYYEEEKKEIEKNLKKEKKIYAIYNEIDKEDLTQYYLFIIYRNLKGE